MIIDPGFATLCRRELELCALRDDERVVVLTHGDEAADRVDPFLHAAGELGASAYHLRLPAEPDPAAAGSGLTRTRGSGAILARHPGALAALQAADLVIDLMFLLFSPEQRAILGSGTRILLTLEPVDVLARLLPTPELRERAEASEELLASADAMRITSRAGTDVTYRLGAYPTMTEYGYTDTPGRWDHWPAGFVFTAGADDGVDGTVVVAPGDILFPFRQHAAQETAFRIEEGRIVDVAGGGEAAMVREYMASFDDPDAYAISHIGWGLNEHARWWGSIADPRVMGMEARAAYGNVLFSTGPNLELGGANSSACHIDIPMRGCSLLLDDEPVLLDGEIVVDEISVSAAERAAATPR